MFRKALTTALSLLPLITPLMLEPDDIPLEPLQSGRWVWEWQPSSSAKPDMSTMPQLPELPVRVASAPVPVSVSAPVAGAPASSSAPGSTQMSSRAPRRTRTASAQPPVAAASPAVESVRVPEVTALQPSEPVAVRAPKSAVSPAPSVAFAPEVATPRPAKPRPAASTLSAPEGALASWKMGRNAALPKVNEPAARVAPAAPVDGPIATWEMGRRPGRAEPQVRGEAATVCAHCGKPALSKEQIIRELSSKYGIEVSRDSSGRLKVRSAPGGTPADIRAAISGLQQSRALKCAQCGTVFCQDCLTTHAPSLPEGGKACPICRDSAFTEV